MTIFVESLKRIYHDGKIGIEKLEELLSSGKINDDEFLYIIDAK